jgi:hypothetical protein
MFCKQKMMDLINYIGLGIGLFFASLIVYSEQAEFNDFPAPISVGVSFALVLGVIIYYTFFRRWTGDRVITPLLFILFFQATAIRSAEYSAFTQAFTLTILFLAWSAYQQRSTLLASRPLLIIYALIALLSGAVVFESF